MRPADLEKISFVTRRFRELQGLRVVPQAIGILALGFPYTNATASPVASQWEAAIFVAVFASCFALAFILLPASHGHSALVATKVFYLAGATAMFGDWWSGREHRADQVHVALLGFALLVIACCGNALGLFDAAAPKQDAGRAVFFLGTSLALRGLIDHCQLIHAFRLPKAQKEDGL